MYRYMYLHEIVKYDNYSKKIMERCEPLSAFTCLHIICAAIFRIFITVSLRLDLLPLY